MLGRLDFRFELKEINRWKKTAAFYNKSLTEFFKDAVNFYIKYHGKSVIFNQSDFVETTKRNEEMLIKVMQLNEQLLIKLNEAREEVKNNQNLTDELTAIRKLVMADTHKALAALPKIQDYLSR